MNDADEQGIVEYSREHIPQDQETPPYSLTGLRRSVYLALYVLIVSSSIGGLIYTFYVSPLFGLIILPVCYVTNNLLFLTSHCRLHASFIELAEAEMGVICHNSFIHLYWASTFLEKVGLASTKHHSQHHRHQLHTLDDVDVWLDLRVPLLETLASRLWKIALTKYVPGQTNMTGYIGRAGSLIACLVFLINPVIYVVVFLRWFD